MPGRLHDKIALVFGAGSIGPGWGNGKAAAVAFAREGAKVVAVDRDLAAAEETRGIIAGEGGVCQARHADVTKTADVEAVVRFTLETHGRIDILHNNVGIAELGGVVEASEESWDRVMDVNLKSMFRTCKAVLPAMLQRKSGAIINIASVAGIRYLGVPYISYAASKAAVIQLTQAVALQHAKDGIRANAILPGLMQTPMVAAQLAKQQWGSQEEADRARAAMTPMGRQGDAWDVAWAAVYLASEEAKYVTGVALPVDGGLVCKVV